MITTVFFRDALPTKIDGTMGASLLIVIGAIVVGLLTVPLMSIRAAAEPAH